MRAGVETERVLGRKQAEAKLQPDLLRGRTTFVISVPWMKLFRLVRMGYLDPNTAVVREKMRLAGGGRTVPSF